MKFYHSIITKISIIFALAIIGVIALLYTSGQDQRAKEIDNMEKFARVVIHSSFDWQKQAIDFEKLKAEGFTLLNDEKIKREIIANLDQREEHPMMMMKNFRENMRFGVKAVGYQKEIYVVARHPSMDNLVFKTPFKREIFQRFMLPLIAITFIIFLYIATIRSITPLYALRKKVKEFAAGNYDIDCQSNKKDEIAILSNEFDKSVKKIKKLRDSRQLFLRNIMHEFKTPITKGKLASEMLENSNYQNILKNVFLRQESLLEEFSRIEKLSADELHINKQKYNLQDIVDFSLDILNHNEKSVECRLSAMSLHVDFELFATALKNLLDNGINYSNDAHVKIESIDYKIIITSSGKGLEFPLHKYSEPYFLGGQKQKSSRGLGFGLFIVWHIVRLHKMKIEYVRENDKNSFTIDTKV